MIRRILLYSLWSLLLTSLLWFVIEIPLLESLPGLMYKVLHRSVYVLQQYDEEGIPYIIYPKAGKQYNPLMVANQAMRYSVDLTKNSNRIGFLKCTDWLESNLFIKDDKAFAQYNFPNDTYHLSKPWSSALAQSVIMNVLYQRYLLSNEDKWLSLSKQVLNTFKPGKSNIALDLGNNQYWYEEYPSQPPSYVLNGMLGILLNMHSYYTKTSDALAISLFDKGYDAVIQRLPTYNAVFISKYDMQGKIASMAYHQMHIDLLKELNAIRPNPTLKHYIRLWQFYRYIPAPIQLIFNFTPMRFLVFALCWLALSIIVVAINSFFRLRHSNQLKLNE